MSTSWWERVDWLNALGEAVVAFAGPLGAPLKFLLEVRSDLQPDVSNAIVANYAGIPSIKRVGDIIRSSYPNVDRWVPEAFEFAAYYASVAFPAGSDVNSEEFEILFVGALDRLRARLDSSTASLREAFANHFYDREEILILLRDSGINISRIRLGGNAEQIWFSVLEYLRGNPPLLTFILLYEAHKRKPDIVLFRAWCD